MSERTWPALTGRLISGVDLEASDTAWAMSEVMAGRTSDVRLAAFLVALAAKGETVSELEGLADAMLEHARKVPLDAQAVDIVGTGGDRHFSVNISTMAALVVASGGVRVVKHGNRASTSKSGSADVLGALGVNLELPPEEVARVAKEVGIAFLFAQVFHPAFRHAGPARKELGLPTAFNVLGPLTNPAKPIGCAIGVGNEAMAPIVAGVFANRGTAGLVFRSDDGLDELSTTAPARIWEVAGGKIRKHTIDFVAELGFKPATLADLRGGSPEFNAQVVKDLLGGKESAVRDVVLINAAAAYIAAEHSGIGTRASIAREPSSKDELLELFREGIAWAGEAIDSGASQDLLNRWVNASNA